MAPAPQNATTQNNLKTLAPTLITAALTVVFMVLPWLHIPLADLASMFGAATGVAQVPGLLSDYNMFQLIGLINMIPDNGSSEMAAGRNTMFAFIASWGIAILLVVGGAILYYLGKKQLLIAGSVVSALVAIAWCALMLYVQRVLNEQANGITIFQLPPWPYLTILASIATIVLAVVMKPAASTATAPQGAYRAPAPTPQPYPNTATAPSPMAQPHPSAAPTPTPMSQPYPGVPTTQAPMQATRPVSNPNPTPAHRPQEALHVPNAGPTYSPQAQPNAFPIATARTSCICPTCGATVMVDVPSQPCLVNITCGNCRAKFPMEVHPRS